MRLEFMKSVLARAYIYAVILAGALILTFGLLNFRTESWPRYVVFCAIAIASSRMKVTLSAGAGTMSMSFVFILIGITNLDLSETLLLGCLAILAQRLLLAKSKATVEQLLFNAGGMSISIAIAYLVSHAVWPITAVDQSVVTLLAAAAFFVANTFSIALVIGLTERKSPWLVWRDSYFWSFPNYLVGAAVAWVVSRMSVAFGWQASLLTLPVLFVVYRTHKSYVERLEQERQYAEELAHLHRRTIETLALAVEAKDQTTHDHLARVEVYAMEIGRELGLSEPEIKALEAAALLHDIGKLAVPEYIISKPGKLTPEEFDKMKIHPVVGAELVERVQFPYPVAPIVRSHHEKWDGSGYPDGLKGEAIPIGARILSAVDCLDALASDRQYRRALPLEEAIGVVRKESGRSFDPAIVEILSRRCFELEKKAKASILAHSAKLSTDIKVERGASPGAGFEEGNNSADLANLQKSLAVDEARSAALPLFLDKIQACESRQEIFDAVRANLQPIVSYHVAVIYWRTGEILKAAFLDGEKQDYFASLEIPMGMGLSGWVAENAKPILNGNPTVEPGYLNDPSRFVNLGSALAVPLDTFEGVVAVLALYRQERDAFSKSELLALQSIATRIGRKMEAAGLHK